MRTKLTVALLGGLTLLTPSCDVLMTMSETMQTNMPLTEAEVSNGLKEALRVGITNAVTQTSQTDGYLNNSLIRIPFPPEAQKVKEALNNIGMNNLVKQFEESMNHAAENASAKATDIFVDAISKMTITDAMSILKGSDDAATQYLHRTTGSQLEAAFTPIVEDALKSVNVTQYWSDITTAYNQIPFVSPVNTDLTGYVTHSAIDGLFIMVANEEKEIRENPQARVNDILKRVFGSTEATRSSLSH
ncbi:DUF4197 domain-containing protein [Phaeocystidibacter marisrubri]|uniref:DUF4197 domain-containing protein n=1 Tax=Phaeocystidibacter marisrubri TaxID=1577780 RepID=A0A6L3ZJJ5_9FLAO|nr:DUF4197 domain-containing protein [Phaeocystidibacter marisrubri]KAB2818114.1 DUF4197 domain-containing protein [Phaeocystidibacter marisrubri]GGH71880.1 hypothetical protein GCM10011318_15290 [Phaeocystidibacter marisrubri]